MQWNPSQPERWLLTLALLVYMAPTVWKLGVSDSMYHMEQMVLLPSQETWIRQQKGDDKAWLRPTMKGNPRIRKPPLVIWLNMMAWNGLDSETVSHREITIRARYVAWGLALAGILATAWIGSMMYSPLTGARAALVLAAIYSILKQGRMASFDTYLLGWVPLTLALSLAFGRRRLSGAHVAWFVLGTLCSCGAFLTKGAVATLYLLPPLLLVAIFTPKDRIRVLNLFLPLLLGACVYGVWLWDVLENVANASATLSDETTQRRLNPQPIFYYLLVIGLIFPWTFLVIGLLPRIRKWRWAAAVPWLAFLLGIVLFSIPDNRRQRYVVPLYPCFALGFAHLWSLRSGKWFSGWAKGHFILLTGLSLVLPLLMPFQEKLIEAKVFKAMELPGAGWLASIVFWVWLIPLSVWMIQSAFWRKTRFLLPLTAMWIAVVYAGGMHFYVHSYHGRYEHLELSERLHADTAGAKGRRYFCRHRGPGSQPPDDRLLYHSGRYFEPAPPHANFESGSFVLIPTNQEERFSRGNWVKVGTYLERRSYTLYQVP